VADIAATTARSTPGTVAVVTGGSAGAAGAILSSSRQRSSFPRAVTVAEEAVVPDAMEPIRQDMDQETADELRAIERHRLLAVASR